MKIFKKVLLQLICFPSNLIGFIIVLLVRLFWGENLHWDNGLWCELKASSWFCKKFYKRWSGTVLGASGFYGPERKQYCRDHEQFHVRQFNTNVIRLILICIPLILIWKLYLFSFILLVIGHLVWSVPNYIEAWLSNKELYKGNVAEMAAYSLDKEKH